MSTTTVTITRRIRNLGFGSSSQPTGRGTEISAVETPDVVGGLAAVEAEADRVRRVYSGGVHYRIALFVGGKRVRATKDDVWMALAELREFGTATLTVEG